MRDDFYWVDDKDEILFSDVWPFILRRGRADKLVIGPDYEWYRYLIGKRRDLIRFEIEDISNDSISFNDSEYEMEESAQFKNRKRVMKFGED